MSTQDSFENYLPISTVLRKIKRNDFFVFDIFQKLEYYKKGKYNPHTKRFHCECYKWDGSRYSHLDRYLEQKDRVFILVKR